MTLAEKKRVHERFWQGEGPCLILIPPPEPAETTEYLERFAEPRLMWEHEVRRARAVADWPTDGIPTVRPNLGVVFVTSLVGQGYELIEGQYPWSGAPLSESAIREIARIDFTQQDLMQRAAALYAYHDLSGEKDIAPYPPDNQGVFDSAEAPTSEPSTFSRECTIFNGSWNGAQKAARCLTVNWRPEPDG